MENASTTSAVGVLGSGIVAVDSGAALLFDNDDQVNNGYVIDNAISGGGAVDFAGPNDAVTTLNVANSFTGGAFISSGIVDLSNNAALGAGPVTMLNGAIRADHGAKTIGNNFTLPGRRSGLGAFTNITGAITILNDVTVTPSENAGNSTWSGAVSLGAFTLATGNAGPNTDGGSWSGQSLTISGAISGTGGVTQASSGDARSFRRQHLFGPDDRHIGNAKGSQRQHDGCGRRARQRRGRDRGRRGLVVRQRRYRQMTAIWSTTLISGAGRGRFRGPNDAITTLDRDEQLYRRRQHFERHRRCAATTQPWAPARSR